MNEARRSQQEKKEIGRLSRQGKKMDRFIEAPGTMDGRKSRGTPIPWNPDPEQGGFDLIPLHNRLHRLFAFQFPLTRAHTPSAVSPKSIVFLAHICSALQLVRQQRQRGGDRPTGTIPLRRHRFHFCDGSDAVTSTSAGCFLLHLQASPSTNPKPSRRLLPTPPSGKFLREDYLVPFCRKVCVTLLYVPKTGYMVERKVSMYYVLQFSSRLLKEEKETAKVVDMAESIKNERERVEALAMAEHNITKEKAE
ncbi:hypothetical protein LXL04_018845 [Taraxacum kok-saghyz]